MSTTIGTNRITQFWCIVIFEINQTWGLNVRSVTWLQLYDVEEMT